MISVIISMLDEIETVDETIRNIRKCFSDAQFHIIVSGNRTDLSEPLNFRFHPNLAGTVKRYELAARSLSRNFSDGFHSVSIDSSMIVVLTGDTLVTDASCFTRLFEKMQQNNMVLACSQAIGQNFHSVDSDPENGRCGGRFQHHDTSDFMPQFFIVDGTFAKKTGAFLNIKITNPYTSEQCLGDEFMRNVKGSFRDNALVFSDNAYQFSDGIKYHAGKQ